MKLIIFLVSAALALTSCMASQASAPGAQDAGDGVFPYDVIRASLDNGLQVRMIPMQSEGLVAYWTVVRTGSRDEVEEGVTGFAHFFEHVMFRGTKNIPQDVYEDIVARMGADSNAFTTDDLTAYHLSFTNADLPQVIEIEADRFQNLEYEESVFRTESGAVYGEYRKGRTNPFQVLFEGLMEVAFDEHTYRHTTIGFEEDIQRMPEQFEYSKSFFRRFYRPENCVVVVAGDFDPDAALAKIREHYEGWQPGYEAPAIPEEPVQVEQRRINIPFEGKTLPILTVNFKGERFLPGDRLMMAASLIGELGFGETSDLYKKLVLDEQRVQGLFESFSGYNRDPNLWSVFAMIYDAADVAAIESEIFATLEDMKRNPVAPERLDAVRSRMKYGFLSDLSTPSDVCSNLARLIAITGDLSCVDEMYATLDAVTPEDVQRAANKWLLTERSTVAIVHTEGEPIPEPTAVNEPVMLPVPNDPNVAFKLWFRAGSQNDPAGKEGLAALTAQLVSDGGTKNKSYEEILAALFPLAGFYGSSVDKEMTVVSGQVHRDNVGPYYKILVDAILNPGFREDDFNRIKASTISGIEESLRYSSDEELGKAALYGHVFRGTPYHHLINGTVQALDSITLEDVKAFYAEYFTRDNVVIGLGGAYPDSLASRIQADLARLPEGTPEPVPAPQAPPIDGRNVVLVDKAGPSTAISFGYPIDLHRGSREYYALWIANAWLGEHRNSFSHLYQVIRETRGMNYGDYSYIEVFPRGGSRSFPPTGVGRRQHLFEVWVRPVPRSQSLFALRAAIREVDHLIAEGLSAEDFEKTREFLKKYCLHYAETSYDRLGYAVDDRFYGIEEGHLRRFAAVMDEITHEEVNAAIRKHLQTEDMVIAMVTEDAAGLRDALVSGEVWPIDYGETKKAAQILAEDKEIEAYPLSISAERVLVIPVEEMFEGGNVQ